MLSLGVDLKVTSEMLGHSTISITADLYSHVLAKMQKSAANKIDVAFSVKPGEQGGDNTGE